MLGRREGESWPRVYSDLSIAKHSESGRIETDLSQIYQDSLSKIDTPQMDKNKTLSFKQTEPQGQLPYFTADPSHSIPSVTNAKIQSIPHALPREAGSKTSINPALTLGSGSIPNLETKNSEYTPRGIETMLAGKSGFMDRETGNKGALDSEAKAQAHGFKHLMQERVECEISQCLATQNLTEHSKVYKEAVFGHSSGKDNQIGDPFNLQNRDDSRPLESPDNISLQKRPSLEIGKIDSAKDATTLEVLNYSDKKHSESQIIPIQQIALNNPNEPGPNLMNLNFFKEKEPIQTLPPFAVLDSKGHDLLPSLPSDLATFRSAPHAPNLQTILKNLTQTEEGSKAIEDSIIVSLVENFLEDSLYKEIFLPSAEPADGIDTSAERVSGYVADFIEYLQSRILIFIIYYSGIICI